MVERSMKERIKYIIKSIAKGPLQPFFSFGCRAINMAEYRILCIWWYVRGGRKPSKKDISLMLDNVTFIYKSFERQKMAKRLYHNIQTYYPGVRVIIADDSSKTLDLQGENLTVLQLPYNSGLSYGLNRALEKVETPFVIRMDDDELLTPFTKFEEQLKFLLKYKDIHMVGVLPFTAPQCRPLRETVESYMNHVLNRRMNPFGVPFFTWIDEQHVILRRTPNIFIVRTDKLRQVGYDDNIRMLDHTEFFIRATGVIHTVMDITCFVFHYHDWFDWNYMKHRRDVEADYQYIEEKLAKKVAERDNDVGSSTEQND